MVSVACDIKRPLCSCANVGKGLQIPLAQVTRPHTGNNKAPLQAFVKTKQHVACKAFNTGCGT